MLKSQAEFKKLKKLKIHTEDDLYPKYQMICHIKYYY